MQEIVEVENWRPRWNLIFGGVEVYKIHKGLLAGWVGHSTGGPCSERFRFRLCAQELAEEVEGVKVIWTTGRRHTQKIAL